MASSAHTPPPNPYGTTVAPPPTPSTQPSHVSTSDAADAISRLFQRLPPALSLPTRASPRATSPPSISFSDQNLNLLSDLLSSSSQHGFFQLIDHSIPSQLARSAESDSLALFDLPRPQKQHSFPKNWPLGFDADEDEEDGAGEAFCLESSCSTESTHLSLSSLREFTRAMEKLGLDVLDSLARAAGFENPFQSGSNRVCPLTWISEDVPGNKPDLSGRVYPYIIGLQYQITSQKHSLLVDSGWITVLPRVDSVMVTVGDIAQVWCNGKLKKVRGRAVVNRGSEAGKSSRSVSMALLLTLPLDTPNVSPLPLLPHLPPADHETQPHKAEEQTEAGSTSGTSKEEEEEEGERPLFRSFSFEDYAWRVYHERLLLKDPLDRYRI